MKKSVRPEHFGKLRTGCLIRFKPRRLDHLRIFLHIHTILRRIFLRRAADRVNAQRCVALRHVAMMHRLRDSIRQKIDDGARRGAGGQNADHRRVIKILDAGDLGDSGHIRRLRRSLERVDCEQLGPPP